MAKIFLVDDELSTCEIMGRFFKMKSLDYVYEVDANNAFSIYKKENPDIVLIDINLGKDKITGIDILEQIRVQDSVVKIIMLSGMVMTEQYEKRCRELNADAFIQKPFAPESLIETIHNLLSC